MASRAFLIAFFLSFITGLSDASESIGKVVDSYSKETTTYMMLETNRLLNTSQTVYLQGGIPIVVREVMSISEKEGINYYRAYSPEKLRVLPGEAVYLDSPAPGQKSKLPDFERSAIFMKKKHGNVTLVEGNKIMINRGSLHDVDKRDVYMIYDANGKAKGQVELYGIGDFLSTGKAYKSIEYMGASAPIEPGDKIQFMGNRKILGLGVILSRAAGQSVQDGSEDYVKGVGLLSSIYFRNGWSLDWLIGQFSKKLRPTGSHVVYVDLNAPLVLKKSFYYPGTISPFLGLGVAQYKVQIKETAQVHCPGLPFCTTVLDRNEKTGLIPFPSLGVEFFTGNAIHLRIETHYYDTPSIDTQNLPTSQTKDLHFFSGVSMNW